MKTTIASVFLLFIIFSVTPLSFLFGVANATNEPGAGGGGLALGRPRGNPCPEVVAQRPSGDNGIPVIFSNSDSNDGVVRLSSDINIEFVPLRPKLCQTTTVWKVNDYDHSAGKWWVITDGVKGNPGANTLTSWFRIEKVSDVYYKFKPKLCQTTTVWKVNDYDHSAGKWWVITDGVKGNPGANTLTSWFRIEKVSDVYYKFKYCPAVCETCPALCNEIGRDFDGEMIRLALSTGNGWPFYFKKVEKSAMEIQQVAHI
ncbi:hypothetical protein GOBAR_AA31512 [Gossypium barbadense]|uniref:21 kDa seed protein n=1 Tax=Gossypium barbadense TaxID=3634 RepID=A0A2P5WDL3_GOSBA|nr:hypothetical protein GOBAR_AA31512 [Gossypium barbadense]